MTNKYKKFTHIECEYYPCHPMIDGVGLNCKFCFCPLYNLKNCGGNYVLLPDGTKDCTICYLPHEENGHDYIVAKLTSEHNVKHTIESGDTNE